MTEFDEVVAVAPLVLVLVLVLVDERITDVSRTSAARRPARDASPIDAHQRVERLTAA